jgi:cold shock CspA family protein
VQFSGTLKFFNSDRANGGYGFIIRDDDPTINDFFHVTTLNLAGIRPECLEAGVTRFSYDLMDDPKNGKTKATNMRIID